MSLLLRSVMRLGISRRVPVFFHGHNLFNQSRVYSNGKPANDSKKLGINESNEKNEEPHKTVIDYAENHRHRQSHYTNIEKILLKLRFEYGAKPDVEAILKRLAISMDDNAILRDEIKSAKNNLSNEIETKREILLRRTVRQEIEAIELEFKKLRFLVESLNTNSETLTEWQKHNTDIPALFVMPPYLKLRFNENILDIIQSRREERLYWYLENPPKVQTSFMRHFFAFKEKLDARNHDYRLAATSFGFLYRIISNPYHEESDILLDKYPKDDRISRTIHHNIIAEVLLDGLDIQPADKK